ncbi:hypothetical protein DVH24_016880 [Malus domestica]|uniref:Uncharacterized protein n=1 Tax=Malus domestica TaxID=3750 RepID=A0A498IUK4_MALDO|nr:hypothetical protein DVH24_016880 [Malus domestica]
MDSSGVEEKGKTQLGTARSNLRVHDRQTTIGICTSNQGGEQRRASSSLLLPAPRVSPQPPPQPQPPQQHQDKRPHRSQSANSNKMKGLFKSKPRTPADIVHQTRDLLVYAQRAPDPRESKREEKNLSILLGPLLSTVICLCVNLDGTVASRNMLAVLAWVFARWLTEAVPMPVTSMSPLFLFPLFDNINACHNLRFVLLG